MSWMELELIMSMRNHPQNNRFIVHEAVELHENKFHML